MKITRLGQLQATPSDEADWDEDAFVTATQQKVVNRLVAMGCSRAQALDALRITKASDLRSDFDGLTKEIQSIRRVMGARGELKWSKTSERSLDLYLPYRRIL